MDPSLSEIRVTFDRPMSQKGYAWCRVDDGKYPETKGEPYWKDGVTAVLPVKLQPGREYSIWLNWGDYRGFKDEKGVFLEPYHLTFKTRSQ